MNAIQQNLLSLTDRKTAFYLRNTMVNLLSFYPVKPGMVPFRRTMDIFETNNAIL